MEVLDEKFTSVTGETYMIKESGKIISRGRTDRQVKQTVQRQYLTIDQLKNLNEIVDRINKEKIDISFNQNANLQEKLSLSLNIFC